MIRANQDLRKYVADEGAMLWQLAAQLGITDSNLSRMLRFELSDEEKEKMKEAVRQFKASVKR